MTLKIFLIGRFISSLKTPLNRGSESENYETTGPVTVTFRFRFYFNPNVVLNAILVRRGNTGNNYRLIV